jgi:hypothetical protein
MAQTGKQSSPGWLQPAANERLTGLVLVILVGAIWIAASFVVQELRLHPFLITYICNILFVLYLPVTAIQDIRRCRLEIAPRIAGVVIFLLVGKSPSHSVNRWMSVPSALMINSTSRPVATLVLIHLPVKRHEQVVAS